MKFIDRAFSITLLMFLTGALAGLALVYPNRLIQQSIVKLLQYRVIGPVKTASSVGSFAVFLLILINNTFPALLSFLYPVLLGKIHWTPPMTENRLKWLLTSFSALSGFVIGFFDLGATLAVAYTIGGQALLNRLIASSWLHGPLEFLFVLLAVSEPLRLVGRKNILNAVRKDWRLLLTCAMGLFVSALIEVYLGI